jgi:hypothetical protein
MDWILSWILLSLSLSVCYVGIGVFCRWYIKKEIKKINACLGNFYLDIAYGDWVTGILVAPVSFPAFLLYKIEN